MKTRFRIPHPQPSAGHLRFSIAHIGGLSLILFLASVLASCGSRENTLTQRTQFIMGTLVEITVRGGEPQPVQRAIGRAFDEMSRLESLMSTHLTDSELSRINAAAGGEFIAVSPETATVLKSAVHWGEQSGGAMDITLGPVVDLWHFDAPSPAPPAAEKLKQALSHVGLADIEIEGGKVRLARPGMRLHLGAVAKGYAVDRAIEVLKRENVPNAMINAGGDLMAIGTRTAERPWNIGLQHPRKPERMIATFSLTDGAVATSGDYQRYFIKDNTRYHHILDPKTGQPVQGTVYATVRADSVMDADAIATALFVMGAEKGIAWIDTLPGVEGMLIPASGPARYSQHFRAQPGYTEQDFKIE